MLHKSAPSFALILVVISALPLCAPCAVAQDKMWRIGFLDLSVPPTAAAPSRQLAAFQQGLAGLGYLEGRNYILEARFADTDRSRLPALAKELVDRGVDVIVTIGTPTVRAAKKATATIPIIMAGSNDPVGNGLVASLAHPGGNVTGFAHTPGPRICPQGTATPQGRGPEHLAHCHTCGLTGRPLGTAARPGLSSAAKDLELTLLLHNVNGVKSEAELQLDSVEDSRRGADALFVLPEFVNSKYEKAIIDFALANRLPSMGQQHKLC